MPGPVTREEFDELADEVRGEKVVTRHILEQTRRNGDDLAVLKTGFARVEEKVDRLDHKVDRLETKIDGLELGIRALSGRADGGDAKIDRVDHKVDTLARDMPRIVADTMREVLREERERK
jgi:phage shock protein A